MVQNIADRLALYGLAIVTGYDERAHTITIGERAAIDATVDAMVGLYMSGVLADCTYEVCSLTMSNEGCVRDLVIQAGLISELIPSDDDITI